VQRAALVASGQAQDTAALQARLLPPAGHQNTIGSAQAAVQAPPIINLRTVTFSETADGNTCFIDCKEHDPGRDDITVTLGALEQWTPRNIGGKRQVFHIHRIDFPVTSINGLAQPPQDLFGRLASLAGEKQVSEASLWEQAICRPGETPSANRRGAYAGDSEPPIGAKLLR